MTPPLLLLLLPHLRPMQQPRQVVLPLLLRLQKLPTRRSLRVLLALLEQHDPDAPLALPSALPP